MRCIFLFENLLQVMKDLWLGSNNTKYEYFFLSQTAELLFLFWLTKPPNFITYSQSNHQLRRWKNNNREHNTKSCFKPKKKNSKQSWLFLFNFCRFFMRFWRTFYKKIILLSASLFFFFKESTSVQCFLLDSTFCAWLKKWNFFKIAIDGA